MALALPAAETTAETDGALPDGSRLVVSDGSGPRIRLPELKADTAIKFAVWLVSVAIMNRLVGSPITDLYIGFSLVFVVFRFAWKTASLFEEPPNKGTITLTDRLERRYHGAVDDQGSVHFEGPEGRSWTGTAWSGRWTLEDSAGKRWWGRVGRKGDVRVHDEDEGELLGTLRPDANSDSRAGEV